MKHASALLISALLLLPAIARADDWPGWRGPSHNGISAETDWLDSWPKDGPPVAWKASVGTGFSSMAVAKGRLFTLGNASDKDTVWCLDAVSGKKLWSHSYDSPLDEKQFEGGPTSTPAVDENHLYTLSRWGDVFCFEAASGKIVWSKNVQKESGVRVPGWGFSSSPVIHEHMLLLNIGEAGMALDKRTGKILWSSPDKDAGYSSPVVFKRDNDSQAIFSADDGWAAVDVKTGKEIWRIKWLTRYGVNAADPIVSGDTVFVSSGYNKGGALLNLAEKQPADVWRNRNMRNQMNSCVLLDGFLYGIDGDTTTKNFLKCVELKTGEVRWSHEGVGMGSLMAANGKLIVLSDTGELMVSPASPEGFKPSARAKVLDGKCWTVPVLANGRVYCRNAAGDLVCLHVRGERK